MMAVTFIIDIPALTTEVSAQINVEYEVAILQVNRQALGGKDLVASL